MGNFSSLMGNPHEIEEPLSEREEQLKRNEERLKKKVEELEKKWEEPRQKIGEVDQKTICSTSTDMSTKRRALPMGKKYHVFLSYSNSDKDWVEETVRILENTYGLVCCVHHQHYTPTTSYLQFAAKSIRNAYKTVAVITKEAFMCDFVLCEIQMALTQGSNELRQCIVPVLLDNCEPPAFLSNLNVIYARDSKERNTLWKQLLDELEIEPDLMYLSDHQSLSTFVIHRPTNFEKLTDLDSKLTDMYMKKPGVTFHLATELENILKANARNVEFRIWLGTDIAKQKIVFVCLYRGAMQKTVANFMGIDIYYKDSETPSRPFEPPHKMPMDNEMKLGIKEANLLQNAISIHGLKLFEQHSNLEAITGSSFLLSKSRGCIQHPSVVLYCRVKGIVPIGEIAFPTTLTTGEDSPIVLTDVREGYLRQGMFQPSEVSKTGFHDKLRMGISIGVQTGHRGTLGPFVKINDTEVGFLTCAHVVVSNPRDRSDLKQSVGMHVYQPADGESPVPESIENRYCGEISRIVFNGHICDPMNRQSKPVGVDAALIACKGDRDVDYRGLPYIPRSDLRKAGFDPSNPPMYGHGAIQYPLEFKDIQGKRIIKYGATTGLTKGTLLLNGTMVKIHNADLELPVTKEKVIMMGQYVVERQGESRFFELGDSGAGVFFLDEDNKLTCIGLAIGYLNEWQTVVTPIQNVLKELGLELDAMKIEEDMKT